MLNVKQKINRATYNNPESLEESDMAEEEQNSRSKNPHTQLDEIADAINAGVPAELIVHESELEERTRTRQFAARLTISLITISIFIIVVILLFFFEISDSFRDLLNILIGGFLATFTKISDYWFKGDGGDPPAITKG